MSGADMKKRGTEIVGRDEEPGEAELFVAAMGKVAPLRGPVRVAPGPPTRGRKGRSVSDRLLRVASAATSGATAATAPSVEASGEQWAARANGIDRRVLRDLGTGKMAVEARVDLHGRTRQEALRVLDRFLTHALATGLRCLLVIHGRGLHSTGAGPTLRDAVREALTAGAAGASVLAASSAPPALGGAGATVVWLRRGPSETRP